jgi:hypothetical protein
MPPDRLIQIRQEVKGNRRVRLGCRHDEQAAVIEELRIRGSD